MKLDAYLEEFEDLDPEDRLEILMDFGPELPPLGPGRNWDVRGVGRTSYLIHAPVDAV